MTSTSVHVVDPPKEAIPIPATDAPLTLTGWDHTAFVVPDLVAAERWYVEVLGAEVVGRYNWGGDTAHQVGSHGDVRVGKDIISLFLGDPTNSTPRLLHHAFNCRSLEELDTWKAHLERKGIEIRGPIAHDGFGALSIYFADPWGYRLEIATWLADFETARTEALKRPGGGVQGRRG
jgi:catechol 2,3-dioxygenase-like lactoylglutathione lyase family enzyme